MNLHKAIDLLREKSSFFDSHIHGIKHWKTVERNGLYLAQFNSADTAVVSYFAYFHDCMRENDSIDPEHGPRAVTFMKQHRQLVDLDDQQFKLLCQACSGHTHGKKARDITVATCWDADRLDIHRVGIVRDPKYFFNQAAIDIVERQADHHLQAFRYEPE